MRLCDDACSRDISGGYSDGVPPLPIPNREVKPDRADGTAHPRESRSPPFYNKPRDSKETRGFVVFRRSGGSEWGSRGVCLGRRDSAGGEEDVSAGGAVRSVVFEERCDFREER